MARTGRSDAHPYRDEESFTPSQLDILNELTVVMRRTDPDFEVKDLIVLLEYPSPSNFWQCRTGRRRIEGKYHLKIEAILIDIIRKQLDLPTAFPRHVDTGMPAETSISEAV